ncbi:MAG: NUDIX hydrolase [Candidatus Paceibacterota bacterium]
MKKVGVSQKAIIFNREGKFLAIRRTKTAPSNPGMWDFPGGDLEFGEDAMDGIIREIREESGLEVKETKPFDIESHINKEGDFWVTIAYSAQAVHGEVFLSNEHDEYKWLDSGEFLKLESAAKIKRFVNNLNTR